MALTHSELETIDIISKKSEQKDFFEVMALKVLFRGRTDEIIQNNQHEKNPFLNEFLKKYSIKKQGDTTQKIAEILAKKDYKNFQKILDNATMI